MEAQTSAGVATNGLRTLAYDVTGSGPDLLLLHGLSSFRDRWHTLGYVERFAKRFRVITMDFDGHGQSSKPHETEAYALDNVLADVGAVLDAAGAERPTALGFSYGGRLALHLSTERDLAAAIALGARFGPAMSQQRCNGFVAEWDRIAGLIESGQFDPNDFSEEFRIEIERNDPRAVQACTLAFGNWRKLTPAEISAPTLFLVGDRDAERIEAYHEWHGEMLRNPQITAATLAGADHGSTFFDPRVARAAVDRYLNVIA
jgi:pimeloyl-ACP methyl ester carboxylesterase